MRENETIEKWAAQRERKKSGERGWRWSCWSWLWQSDTGTAFLPFSISQLYHPPSDELQNVSDMADIKRLEGWGEKCGENAVLSIKVFFWVNLSKYYEVLSKLKPVWFERMFCSPKTPFCKFVQALKLCQNLFAFLWVKFHLKDLLCWHLTTLTSKCCCE